MILNDILPQMQVLALATNVILVLFILPLRKSIEEIRKDYSGLKDEVHMLKVELARNYARRDEVITSIVRLEGKLDTGFEHVSSRIEAIQQSKADK